MLRLDVMLFMHMVNAERMGKGLGRVQVRLSTGRVVTLLKASDKLSAAVEELLRPWWCYGKLVSVTLNTG
jgi:hypothetical protein